MQNNGHKNQGNANGHDGALVIFGVDFDVKKINLREVGVIVADKIFKKEVENSGHTFIDIDTFIEPGSVEEANIFLNEISSATFPNGQKISKSFMFEGYELWWVHYNDFFHYFCLPYTRYKKLLGYLRNFGSVTFYNPPFKNLFSHYLHAYECRVSILGESWFKKISTVPFGIFVQVIITFFSVLILAITRPQILVFTGDSLEPSRDYDFRMKFIYEELRHKELSFVEFIRSLESWKTVVEHALIRRRPVVYSEAVVFSGRIISVLFCGHHRVPRKYTVRDFSPGMSPEMKFKLAVATHYLFRACDDVWATRIMRLIENLVGIKAAFIAATTERNFHAVLGCKLSNIPIVGILHGVAFRHVTPYDFMSGFTGIKSLSVDAYGVWSEWWKEYYSKYSHAYKPEQLHVSGPMRPLEAPKESMKNISTNEHTRVLFVSEQVAIPDEIMPYLRELLGMRDIELTIKFRPSRDGFEKWLTEYEPQILKLPHLRIVKGTMQEAIQNADVVIGSYSTGVLEALLQLRIPIFLKTKKWGDYFSMTDDEKTRCLLVENPHELKEMIKNAHTLSKKLLIELREQYFGDPHKNGSKWVVDRLEKILKEEN